MDESVQSDPTRGTSARTSLPDHDDMAPNVRLRRLFVSIPFATACTQLGYSTIGYFTALQVQFMDPTHKAGKLALVNATIAIVSIIAAPAIGVLSDRTRTRFGARTPWMFVGILTGCFGLALTGLSTSIAMLLVTVSVATLGIHTFHTPLSAIQPDRVPVERRGRFSSLFGLGRFLAGALTPVIGAQFAFRIPLGYTVVAAAILVVGVTFLVLNPDTSSRGLERPRLSLSTLARTYWVNPVRHPDFFWVFLGRFLIFSGYHIVSTFQLYILQDYIGLDLHDAVRLTPILGLASLPGLLAAIGISGWLSDRMGRRKPLILMGGLLIAASALIPIAVPTVPGMISSMIMLAIGFGTFLSVDQALATQALPSTADAGKDLGLIEIAGTLPNVIAPATAGLIISSLGGYGALYATVALIAGLGALAVLFVKIR